MEKDGIRFTVWKKLILWCAVVVGLVTIVIMVCYWVVSANAEGRVYDSVSKVPHNKYGMLLATSPVTRSGTHNFTFDNRINATDSLFKAGKIDYVIASGGNYVGVEEYGCDEPGAIRDSLIARGWPEDRIILDYEGTRTLNSIVKARSVYDIDSVTLISQKFHNERAIYLADLYGLHAVGYNAPQSPILKSRIKTVGREFFARPNMFFEIFMGKDADIKGYQ